MLAHSLPSLAFRSLAFGSWAIAGVIAVMGVTSGVAQGDDRNARSAGASPAAPLIHPVVPLSPDDLYEGWRASGLLGSAVATEAGHDIGTVRNVLVSEQGEIRSLIVEREMSNGSAEFVFRLPWNRVDASGLPHRLTVTFADGGGSKAGLGEDASSASEFQITKVIGDYARLQAGQAFGYVSDVVFSRDGAMIAVLVVRDEAAGGGTFAFGFPGTIGKWNPQAGYYGLPYVTAGNASRAALRVDVRRFDADEAG